MSGDNKGVRRRWWWRWLRVSLIVIGVLFLLLAGTRLVLLYRVRSAISAIRDRGVPATSAELAAMYGPAAGQGAEDSFAEALESFRVRDLRDTEAVMRFFDRESVSEPDDLLSAKVKREFATSLASNEEAMSLLEKVLARGACRLPLDLRPSGFGPYDKRLGQLKQAVLLFHTRAVMAVEQRDPDAAVQAILTQFALARSLGDAAQSPHRKVRSVVAERATRDIETALNARILDDRHFSVLDKAIREEETHSDLLTIIQGERCRGIDVILMTGGFGPVVPFVKADVSIVEQWFDFVDSVQDQCRRSMDLILMRGGYYGLDQSISDSCRSILEQSCDCVGFLQADYLHYLRNMDQMEEIARKPYLERVAAAKKTFNGLGALTGTDFCFHRFCTYLHVGPDLVEESAGILTLLRCARVAMAAERYRVARGELPDQLTDLTPAFLPEIPLSPITSRPLSYRKWEGNCRVYGPGACMKDLGGNDMGRTYDRSSGDTILSLYAPTGPIPALRCVVRGKKVIMTGARGLCTGSGEMALSPTGRHLLFMQSVDSGPRSGAHLHQPMILDLASSQQTDLPVKPMDLSKRNTAIWMDNIFSAKGNYVHACATRVEDPDESIVLYDVNTRKTRRFSLPNSTCVVSDLTETHLWINERLQGGTNGSDGDNDPRGCRLHMIPFGEGKEERITLPGTCPAICAKESMVIFPDGYDGVVCLLMDLTRDVTIASLPLIKRRSAWPAPFWAPGGRFFCCGEAGCYVRFWDRVRDRTFRFEKQIAIAPGPTPHTVLLGRVRYLGQWEEPRLVNLATGQEWEPISAEDGDCICAVGKYIVCAKTEKDGSTTLTLIEIGLE